MKFSFWKTFGTNILAIIVAGIILLFIFFAWVGFLLGSFDDMFESQIDKPDLEDHTVLKMSLSGPLSESSGVEFEGGPVPFNTMNRTGLHDLLIGIHEAKDDKNVDGILLDFGLVSTGWATAKEIRDALADFKSSGKFIYAYGEMLSQKGYYIASVADSVYLYPTGLMALTGLSANVSFVKGLLDKTGLEMQIIRGSNNQFKSAVEPLMYKEMSDANKLQTRKYINALWNTCVEEIGSSRSMSSAEINQIVDSLLVRNPSDAVEYGLVDRLVYKDQLEAVLRSVTDTDDDEEVEYYSCEKYARKIALNKRSDWEDNGNIAVIYAEGGIVQGSSKMGSIGSDTYAKAVREARKDDDIKAIVLRINSGGGDALASDIIWREVQLAAKEKPLYVSMGDVAASGGYYIAAPAKKIFASKNSITGSIGVFMVWPNTKEMFNKHLGVTFDTVNTNDHSDFMSVTRPLSDFEKKVFQDGVDRTYSEFLKVVADGRAPLNSAAEVDSIGQGRVWSGIDAKEIGLIDEYGGITDAILAAASDVDIDRKDIKIKTLPESETSKLLRFLQAIEDADDDADDDESIEQNKITDELLRQWENAQTLNQLTGFQARLLWNIRVE